MPWSPTDRALVRRRLVLYRDSSLHRVFDLDIAVAALIDRLGRDDLEPVKLTGNDPNLICHRAEV